MPAIATVGNARARFLRALARPHTGRVTIALATLLALPSIAVGFYTDDTTFLVALREGLRPFFDLFRFSSGTLSDNRALVAAGQYPWWTAPDFKLHLIRPLTSIVFALDTVLFGDAPLGYHLDALAWYVALLIAVTLILKHVLPGASAALAALFFALRSGHVLPYAWLSARHVLVAAVPAMFALLAHLRAVDDDWKPGRVLGPVLLVVALSGSEIALTVLPFWVLHDVMYARAKAKGSVKASAPWTAGWQSALRWSAPAIVIAPLYLVIYRLVGGGTLSCQSYHNPFDAPLDFLRVAGTRIPVLLADALLGLPVVFSIDGPVTAIVIAGLAGVVMCGLLLASAWRSIAETERRAISWLVPAALAGSCVGVSGPPWGHVLLVPDLGFAVLIGVLLRDALERAGSSATQILRGAGACVLVAGHFVLAPSASLLAIYRLVQGSHATNDAARTAEIGPTPGARVFVMAAADSSVYFYPRDVLAVEAPGKVACWSVLSGAEIEHRMIRTGPRSFVLQPLAHATHDAYDALFFGPRKFVAGDEVHQCGATIRVDTVVQGRPYTLNVELDEPLESPDLALLVWQDHRLRRFPIPGVGETAEISDHLTSAMAVRKTR